MAVITPDTFDPLRSYIGVRLQQGVPLVDADWNEAHDVRKFEVQAFLKWFVGNGVPEGNDGFRIAGLTSAEVGNFVIQQGVGAAPTGTSPVEQGLRHVGRCLVDGMDVLIDKDINFSQQPLHVNQGGAATALASAWGVPTIAEMPNVTGTMVVYLDVWERLVTPVEDPRLVHSGLGVESCARLKREWVVRTRVGNSVPVPGNADFTAGHSYYALATIAHQANVPITSEAITDQRERRLLVPPATLIEDLFGPVDYRRGQGRPLVNLREAINALLRGDVPSSPEAPIGSAVGMISIRYGTFFDATNGLITTWRTFQPGLSQQIFAARLSLAMPEAGFRITKQITESNGSSHHAMLLDTGEVLIVYETAVGVDGTPNILMKRGTFDTLNTDLPAITVTDTPASERFPFAVAVGGQVLILWHESAGRTWQFKWYNVADGSFSEAHRLSDMVTPESLLHAAVDSTNTVWVAFQDQLGLTTISGIRAIAVPPAIDVLPEPQLLSPAQGDLYPFVMVDNSDNVWVFWHRFSGGGGIWYRRFLRATREWETDEGTQVPGTTTGGGTIAHLAVSDAEGGIWLFWLRPALSGSGSNIWYARHNPVTQTWGEPREITGDLGTDDEPFGLCGPDGSLWLFWRRAVADHYQAFYRRIFPSI